MSKSPLVSVIIPSYNMAEYLPFAVGSVQAQTHDDLEIWVVDDGSTDNTRQVMEEFTADSRVHYCFRENGGLPAARNTGIRQSRGDIIGLCDADDMWEPDKLEKQLPVFHGSPRVGVVYTDAQRIDPAGARLPARAWGAEYRVSGQITRQLVLRNVVTGSTSLIRRECFDAVGLYDESLTGAEDYDLWLRISTRFEFAYLDEVTYLYRQWDGQMSRNSLKMLDNCARILEKFAAQHGDLVESEVLREAWAGYYTDRSLSIMESHQTRGPALKATYAALRHKPGYKRAWKAAAKILINRI